MELENEARKSENRKLAMWAQGRWGGVMFVPGGTLVQGDGYKKPQEEAPEVVELQKVHESQSDAVGSDDKAQRKAEKKRRKEEKRRKRDAGLHDRASSTDSTTSNPKAEVTKATGTLERKGSSREKTAAKEKKKKKRERPALSADDESSVTTPGEHADNISEPSTVYVLPTPAIANRTTPALPRTGRHVIRGRNIEAKKMAFSDVKMLDQVRPSQEVLPQILTRHPDIHGQGLKPIKHYMNCSSACLQDTGEQKEAGVMFNIWVTLGHQSHQVWARAILLDDIRQRLFNLLNTSDKLKHRESTPRDNNSANAAIS